MSRRVGRLVVVLAAMARLAVPAAVHAKIEAPAWLREVTGVANPPNRAPIVVLLREGSITIDESGVVRTFQRGAVRVNESAGRNGCQASAGYDSRTGRVLDFHAWMIRPSGAVIDYGKQKVVDVPLIGEELYNEARAQQLSASSDAEPGSVFGWEYTTEDHPAFATFFWPFQEDVPVVKSRFAISVPAGWKVSSWLFREDRGTEVETGKTTWELADLPAIVEEPDAPPAASLATRLGVSCIPPAGSGHAIQSFRDWPAVARWLIGLTEAAGDPSAEVRARARELIGQSASRLDSIRAIASFVQGIRYVAVEMGLGRGNGYVPHPPGDVLTHSYGDCKDKANLMRAMLRGVGIASYLVALRADDGGFVREEWATPQQFDHCILAVPFGDERDALPAWERGPLGPLLFFDPTDANTSLGDLPMTERGARALVLAPTTQGPFNLPSPRPGDATLERRADLTLAADGSLQGTIQERSSGQAAASERRLHRELSMASYRSAAEHWLAETAAGAVIQSLDATDDPRIDRFGLDLSFSSPRYGQLLQNRLLLFRPAIVARQRGLASGGERLTPFLLRARTFVDSVQVTLPEGFEVDELPPSTRLDCPCGSFTASCRVDGRRLLYSRTLTVNEARIPANEYAQPRDFFGKVRMADETPVVLVKK